MHIHILGICGTFMGSLAVLARELGFEVTGSDQNVYPPMSTQLEKLGIKIFQGYDDITQLNPKPDYVVIGNAMSRGKPVVEAALNQNLPILSGPGWFARFVRTGRHVLAVSGTHGKTTTTSMLAWILECAGLKPGFLIGGVPTNFGVSARLGESQYFVIEADEYDTAFFDKRSKFIHYRPRTLIINNIEFDHADIFPDLAAIEQQFHHLVRTVPGEGLIVSPKSDPVVKHVLEKGCWSHQVCFGVDPNDTTGWTVRNAIPDGSQFEVCFKGKSYGTLKWGLLGQHNVQNALAAIAAAHHVGVDPAVAIDALSSFKNVKRRLENKGSVGEITVYDDFAHHPTAIQMTLAGLRAKVGETAKITAVLDIRSNTMKMGHHQTSLSASVCDANEVYFFQSPDISWDVQKMWKESGKPGGVYQNTDLLLDELLKNRSHTKNTEHIVFMSNGGFGNIQTTFLEKLNILI